jgi:hypothetical protein
MKLKWILFSISLAAFCSSVFSQVNTFNKGFLFLDTLMQESVNQLIEVDDGYLVSGYSDFLRTKLIISKLDFNGYTIWLKKYGDDSLFYQPGNRDAMIQTSDSDFALAVNFTDYGGDYRSRMMIIKFNSAGDTLWSSQLYTPDSTERYCNALGIIETNDRGLLVYGNENYLSGVLIKTDSLGRKEWMKYYGNYLTADSRQILGVRQTSDSGYIAAGYQRNLHDVKSGDARVIKFDKYGNLTWDKVFGSEFEDYIGASIQPVSDTEFVVVSHLTTITSGEPHFFPQGSKLNVIRITENGNIQENYLIGHDEDLPWIADLEIMDDGSFISCGSDIYGDISWIWNFSAEQDSAFFRMINPENYPETFRFINDIKSTSDGGIIACGDYGTVISSEYIRHPWIFKTDRFGCFDMGCDSNGIYITQQPVPATACENSTAILNVGTYSSGSIVRHQWQTYQEGAWQNIEDELIYQGFDEDTLLINSFYITNQLESYRCNFYNDYWSLYSDSVVVNFLDTINIVLQPQSQSIHYGEPANITIGVNGLRPIEYLWFHNDQLIEEEDDSVLFIQNVIEKDTGAYFCRMTNECGAIESERIFLNINNLGVDDENDNLRISIHPNPTDGMLNIWVQGKAQSGNMKLLDLSGRPLNIDFKQIGNTLYEVGLEGVSPGIYFLVIQFDTKKELVRKIIKN